MRRLLRPLPSLLTLLLLVPETASATAQVVKYLMTKPVPPSCAQAIVNYPPAYTSFSTADSAAYLWFYITGASRAMSTPPNTIRPPASSHPDTSGAFDVLTQGGNWCFVDAPFNIAGYQPASLPGPWTVRGLANGVVIFTLQFTVAPATPTCTYTISPSSASVPAAGGAGTATVTAPSGCTWSALPSVSWIASSSSGSGNGTISYTVVANTATTARSGTIAAGGQTLTISQAAATGGGTSGLNLNINQVIDSACPSDRIIVSVIDFTGNPVTGLTAANFTLREAGNARTVSVSAVSSGAGSGALSMAILIDTSGSISATDLTNEKSRGQATRQPDRLRRSSGGLQLRNDGQTGTGFYQRQGETEHSHRQHYGRQ